MLFNFITFPLEDTIFKLNISDLKFLIIAVYSLKVFLFISKEMIHSVHTCLRIDEIYYCHYQQPHWSRNQVKDWKHCVDLGGCESVLPIHGWISSKYNNRSEDRKHIHDDLYVSSVYQGFEAQFYFFSPDILYLISNQLLPAIVLNDSNAREILVYTLSSLVSPKQLVFSQLKPLFCDLVLSHHS